MAKQNTGGASTMEAPSIVKSEKATKRKVRIKEITVRAKRNFTVLPKQVQDETRTRVGAFALPGELSAYRCLTDDEIRDYGGKIIGIVPGETGFSQASNEYFNNYGVFVEYDEGVNIKVPIDAETGEVVLDFERRNHISDIMKYRHVTNHTRIAEDFAQYQEATHLYIGYIEDKSVVQKERLGRKDIRKQAERLYLNLVDEKSDTKIDWVLEVLRRGVKTGNFDDPPTGYTPMTLASIVDVTALPRDDKELAIEEFKLDRLDTFMEIMEDENLEWKALLERCVTGGVFQRKGNVITYENAVVGATDEEAIAQMKATSYGDSLVVIKSKLKNAFK